MLDLFYSCLAWAVAHNVNSASQFVRMLLTAVFFMDVLLVINLHSKSRDSGGQHQAPEKNKMDVIYSTCLHALSFSGTI